MHDVEQTRVDNKVIAQKRPYMTAAILCVVIIIATIGANVYNNTLKSNIASLKNEVVETQDKIDQLNAGSNLLQVSNLLQKNKTVLEKLQQRSNIVSYIQHVSDISIQYGVEMTGFNYTGETVDVEVLSTTRNQRELAYQNIVQFLAEYNDNEKRLFQLWDISQISWHDSIKFGVNFTLK